jgi:anthranilate phosphoribosyltransferase
MREIMTGAAHEIQIAAFLVGLRTKGETAAEISGGARCLREAALPVRSNRSCLDIVGTGGDQAGTFNLSSAAALLAAASGATVAKHGNRAVSSRCGSADVFEALGFDLGLTPDQAAQNLEESGFVFLFAPTYHPAMRHAAPVRRLLGIRTIFNLLGPLANPVRPAALLLGVCTHGLLDDMAAALLELGVAHAWVVHGQDQSDEISLAGPTEYREIRAGRITSGILLPEDLGLPRCRTQDLSGGNPPENALLIERLLGGEPGPALNAVLLNAAVALYLAGLAASPQAGLGIARQTIASGTARRKLAQWRQGGSARKEVAP